MGKKNWSFKINVHNFFNFERGKLEEKEEKGREREEGRGVRGRETEQRKEANMYHTNTTTYKTNTTTQTDSRGPDSIIAAL